MNMKALISTIEPRETGYRVAQVEPEQNVFDVAEGLFWVDCPAHITQDDFWYDPQDQLFKETPVAATSQAVQPQPTVNGAETL